MGAGTRVKALLREDMLPRGVNVAQSALQRRRVVHGAGSAQRIAAADDVGAGRMDPGAALQALREIRLVIERACHGALPLFFRLNLHQRTRRAKRRVQPAKCLLGDKAYDSNELRADLDEQGTKPVIPNRSNRKQRFSFSKRLYKLRWRIEAAFNRLKDFRRIATRYDRLARNYLASVCLAAALLWWI